MSNSYVLGLDPGFSNLGYTLVTITGDDETVNSMGVFRTAKSPNKIKVLASDDNVRRAREISQFLNHEFFNPRLGSINIRAICAESMSFPRSSSVAAKMAMAWGVISSIADLNKVPIVQATPQQIKKSVCGVKTATKTDIQNALDVRYGKDSIDGLLVGVPRSKLEHPYDALAAVVACLESDVILTLRKIANSSARIK